MDSMSREEAEARIEAIESRMDGRVAAFQANCDRYLAEQTAQIRALQALIERNAERSDQEHARFLERLAAEQGQRQEEREQLAARLRAQDEALRAAQAAQAQALQAAREAQDKAFEKAAEEHEKALRIEKEAREAAMRNDREQWAMAQRTEREQRETELRNQQALHEAKMEDFRRTNKEIFRKLDQLFTTVIVTGISSVIAIILGVGAINTAIVNNMFASYNEGKVRASWEAKIEQRLSQRAAVPAPRP